MLTIAGVVMSILCSTGHAERLYTWQDDKGVTHISKEPPPQNTNLKETIKVRMASVDEYVLPPDVTQAYKDAPRTDQKHPSKEILSGKWKGYTPPPMPQKK